MQIDELFSNTKKTRLKGKHMKSHGDLETETGVN